MKNQYKVLFVLFICLISLGSFKPNKRLLPTSLRVTVLDNLGNTVEGASVTLYKNEDAFYNEEEPIREAQLTDAKGRTFFKKLPETMYFIHAVKGEKDNIPDRIGESLSANKLQAGKINLINIIIR